MLPKGYLSGDWPMAWKVRTTKQYFQMPCKGEIPLCSACSMAMVGNRCQSFARFGGSCYCMR